MVRAGSHAAHWGALATVGLVFAGFTAARGEVSKEEPGAELARLYEEDQHDQREWGPGDDEAFSRKQAERRARALEIVQAGLLEQAADFYHAAMLLQHGVEARDFLLAHALACAGGLEGSDEARWLSAATLDRWLQTIGEPQRFGTQFSDEQGLVLLEPFDDSLCPAVRRAYGVEGPNRGASDATPSKKELSAARRELERLVKEHEKLARRVAKGSQVDAAAFAELSDAALAIVAKGHLEDADDFLAAATVLQVAREHEPVLLAHILATAAAYRGKKPCREMVASTLDHYLRLAGRPPLFERAPGEDPATARLLHPDLAARFRDGKRRR